MSQCSLLHTMAQVTQGIMGVSYNTSQGYHGLTGDQAKLAGGVSLPSRYNRQGRKANVGAGTATATEPTRGHKQYATQGPTTYLCT